MPEKQEVYLGDGLYAVDRGFMFDLWCERENGKNWVALEDEVLQAFFRFIEKTRGVKIEVKKA